MKYIVTPTKKLSPVVCRTEITSKKTVFSPKCVRIIPSETGTPRKQLKRNLLKSPKELLRQSINDKKTPSKSPYTKKVRKCLEDELFDNHDIETTCSSFNPGSSLDQSLGQGDRMADIQNLIPNVLENLAEVGCDETFIEFLNQVNNGEFPLQNISFLLWMEVVKWFSCDNTCRMRYSDARDQEILETWLQSIWREVHPFYGRV